MKKNYLNAFLIVTLVSLFANNLFGQGAYLNINAGYGLMMSSGNLPNFYSLTTSSNSDTYKQVNLSLGKGINFGGAFGYMFNKNIGAELGVSYLLGGKSKAQDIYQGGKTDYTLSARMLRINPSIVIASGLNGINPYAKIGLIVGTGSVTEETIDNDGGDISRVLVKMNGGVAIGGNAGLGVLFDISKKISFFSEINMTSLSYAPTKGKATKATYNGIDILSDLTTSEKEIEYVDSYTESNTPPPDSQPSKGLKTKLPFGSIGINLGMRFSF